MLCFIIPLKARSVSNDWAQVCHLFENTLRSVVNQTEPNFRVLVVCHDKPEIGVFDERVEFLPVEFAPPARTVSSAAQVEEFGKAAMVDKYRKLMVGLSRARQLKPAFTMFVDADDLVSNRLAAHAQSHRQSNGWSFHTGYVFDRSEHQLAQQSVFHRLCGTSAMLSTRLYEFPGDDDPLDPSCLERGRALCTPLRYGHPIIADHLADVGTPLDPLPFPGAIYITSHGDNWSTRRDLLPGHNQKDTLVASVRKRLGRARRQLASRHLRVPITPELRAEFHLT